MRKSKSNLAKGLVVYTAILLTACGSSESENTEPNDSIPPKVISTQPVDQDSEVSRNTQIVVNFSEAIAEHSVDGSSFEVIDSSGNSVSGRYTFDTAKSTVRFTPTTLLNPFSNYTVTLGNDITDTAGNTLQPRHSLQFFTR